MGSEARRSFGGLVASGRRHAVVAGAAVLLLGGCSRTRPAASDSAFAAMQARGRAVMGVDQSTSVHTFDDLPDGGRIVLQRQVDDTAGVRAVREHLRTEAAHFAAGDFADPMAVHARIVPGSDVMTARRRFIRYTFREVPRGGELRIATTDSAALGAVHEFLAYQRGAHHAAGHEMPGMRMP